MNEKPEIELIHHEEYLFVKSNSKWTLDAVRETIDVSIAAAEKGNYKRILFDLVAWGNPPSEMIRFHAGEYLAEKTRGKLKVAAFANADAINKFGENVAVNRGAFFRIFDDKVLAINWLLNNEW